MRGFHEGHPFLVHLRAEHERIHEDVCEIERALAARSDPVLPMKILDCLLNLRDELVRHFEEEERGGCIDEAASRCPRLSREARSVERQHPQILQRLNHLIERVDDGDSGIDDELVEDFRQLARTLHAHEAAEHRILKEAFGYSGEEDW